MNELKLASILFLLVAFRGGDVLGDENSAPDAKRSAELKLEAVLKSKLRLSTIDAGGADRFRCEVSVKLPQPDGKTVGMRTLIERDGKDYAMLLMSDTGVPFAYFRDGFICHLGLENPNQLQIHTGGTFLFTCPAKDKDESRIVCELTVHSNPKNKSRVTIDMEPIIRQIIRNSVELRFDAENHTIHGKKRDGSTAEIALAADNNSNRFPIESLRIDGIDGGWFTVGNFRIGAAIQRQIVALGERDFKKLDMPVAVQPVSVELALSSAGLLVQQVVNSRAHRAAGVKFRDAFMIDGPPLLRRIP